MEQLKRVTIRIPITLWRKLRDAITAGNVESINQAALDGMSMLIERTVGSDKRKKT